MKGKRMAKVLAPAREAFINGKPLISCELRLDHQQIDITSEYERDPNWSYVDAAGHFHAWSRNDELPLPTLRGIGVEVPCDGSCGGFCEGYTRTEYHCRACDEIVEPGYRPTSGRKYMPGRTIWSVVVTGMVDDLLPLYQSRKPASFWMAGPEGKFGFGVVDSVEIESNSPIARATIQEAGELGVR